MNNKMDNLIDKIDEMCDNNETINLGRFVKQSIQEVLEDVIGENEDTIDKDDDFEIEERNGLRNYQRQIAKNNWGIT